MGGGQTKQVDNTGEVINSVIVNPVDVQSKQIELILIILTSLVGISFGYQIYKDYRRSLKKRYISNISNIISSGSAKSPQV